MKNKFKLGVIGAGFMATAIVKGVIDSKLIPAKDITVNDVSEEQLKKISLLGVNTETDSKVLAENSEFILFAVKPQNSEEVFNAIRTEKPLKIISIMAGVGKEKIKKYFPNSSVARCMPNTPCSILEGAVGVDSSDFSEVDSEFITHFLSSFATVVSVSEDKMGAITGVSGSSPAYFYYFVKSVIDAGVKRGLSESDAKLLAVKAMEGAAKMIESNPDKSIDELINAVCSKGGTTVEAIKVFDENDLSGIVYKAVSACVNRSDEIESGEKIVEIYTDGACSGNPGAGGYCAILVFGGTEKIVKGYEPDTTNNRMELVAAIEGISSLKESCRVKLYSDSSYLINAFNNGWVFDWKENGWKTAGKAEVKNIDLWEKLLSLYGKHKISFIKVKGHADNDYNNRCDKIAVNEYLSRLS